MKSLYRVKKEFCTKQNSFLQSETPPRGSQGGVSMRGV